jgi:glycerate kinase
MTEQRRVIVAPDSFKGTFDAARVARAMADGVRAAGAEPLERPLADGGEGTVSVLGASLGGVVRSVEVRGPLGEPVSAPILIAPDRSAPDRSAPDRTAPDRTADDDGARGPLLAVIETASAAGLSLVPPDRRDAEAASTYGVGELIVHAARLLAEETGGQPGAAGPRILVGAGGSATTDGGVGAIRAIEDGGGLRGCRLVVLCDVTTPYEDAAVVFGPQKGADPAAVRRLTARLRRQAAQLRRDPIGVPRTGCAGGLSGALWANCAAELVSGIDAVIDAVGLAALLPGALAVLTGEGRLDGQSAQGKAVSGLARRCAGAGVPLHAIVGSTQLSPADAAALGLASVREATDLGAVADAARECVARLLAG